jgi:ATP-binding cassette, subfamily F, member 3
VVSHDRNLLRTTTESLWLVANGSVTEFDGDLDDYRVWLNQSQPESNDTPSLSVNAVDRREQKRQEAQQRNARSAQRRPLENQVRTLEKEIAKLNAEKIRFDALLASDALYGEGRKEDLKLALRQQAETNAKLIDLEDSWLQRQSELEML